MDSRIRLGAFLHGQYHSDPKKTFSYIPSDLFLNGLKRYNITLTSICASVKKYEEIIPVDPPMILERENVQIYSLPYWKDTAHFFQLLVKNRTRIGKTIRKFVSSNDIIWIRIPTPLLGLLLNEIKRQGKTAIIHAAGSVQDAWLNRKHKGLKRIPALISTQIYHFLTRYLSRSHTVLATGPNVIRLFSGQNRKVIPFVDSLVCFAESQPCSPSPYLKLLYVGRIVPRKGLSCIFSAMQILKGEKIKTSLSIVGTGPEMKELKRTAERLGISDSIKWRGFVPQGPTLDQEYIGSSVFALVPEASEGFPRTILEAWSHGLVIIASSVAGLRDIIVDQKNGLLIPKGNPSALAKALLKLLGDDRLKDNLIKNGYKSARSYTFDNQLRIASKAIFDSYRNSS